MDEKNILDEKTLEAVSGGEDWEEESKEYYFALASFINANCKFCGKLSDGCPYHNRVREAMRDAGNKRCPEWIRKQ